MRAAVPTNSSFSAWRAGVLSPVATALIASFLTVSAWVALAAWMNHSQLHDSLEQFVWGQALQWGYWKHPPLTSWLMWAGLHVMGPTPYVTYALAALLAMVTIACTTRLAQLLAGNEVAVFTALLFALHYGFTRRAQVYNHNTVLLACSAGMALATLYAVRRNRLADWAIAGFAAGLALLAKYQAVVPVVGVLLAIVLAGEGRRCLRGVLVAIACAFIVFLPHAVWVVQHGLETIHYAARYVEGSEGGEVRGARSIGVVAMQLKYFLPAIGFALLLWASTQLSARSELAAPTRWSTEQRSWVIGLVLLPMFVIAGAAAFGVRVQSHWGLQATQFLLVPAAVLLHARFGRWQRPHALAWLIVQVLALGIYVAQGAGAGHVSRHRPDVRDVDASAIAGQVLGAWSASTSCELRYLSGPVALAGMVSAYSHRTLRVLEDGDAHKSPWIDLDDMRASGFIEIRGQDTGDHSEGEVVVPLLGQGTPRFLVLQLHAPAQPCQGPGSAH